MIDTAYTRFQELWQQASDIWSQGGWAMTAIAFIAFVMFAVGMSVHLKLSEKGFLSVPESRWREWINRPGRRKGPIGELLDFVTGPTDFAQMAERFSQLHASETVPFERELRVMKVCVSAAPLVGLLGTVTGMLSTFSALSSGSGGDKTMAMVAKGISEALITTETGLVIALPGLFFQYQLTRKFERYKAFLAHLETVCTQALHRRRAQGERDAVRRAASVEVARRLRKRLDERVSAASASPRTEPRPSSPSLSPDSAGQGSTTATLEKGLDESAAGPVA